MGGHLHKLTSLYDTYFHTGKGYILNHGANMGPIWGRQDPGGPHVGLMNIAILVGTESNMIDGEWPFIPMWMSLQE